MFKLNKKGQKALNKSFAFLSIVSLVLQSLSGLFFLKPAYAQEDTSVPTPIPTIEAAVITSTPEAVPTQAPTETVTLTPVIEVPTSTPTPFDSAQGEPINTPTPIVTEPPVLTITPTVTPEEVVQPEVLAASLPQEQSPPQADDLLPSGTDQTSAQLQPSISTDKNDYSPNETAIISGKDLKPNTEYKIVITADKFVFEDKFTSSDKGTFIYSFPLGGTYRPEYKVEILENGIIVASTNFTDAPASGCTPDSQGVETGADQKDLTKMCVNYGGLPTTINVSWNWDDISWSGANTGDACSLFDTDGDGNVNFALCVGINGNPAVKAYTKLYSCTDADFNNCKGPSEITTFSSSCITSIQNTDPFVAGYEYPKDTESNCTITMSDVGGATATLIDVCSYPSGSPNSSASDCILYKPDAGKLTITKNLSPINDAGLFNLLIDGSIQATNVSHGGSTLTQELNTGNHTFAESAGNNTSLTDYSTTVVCKDAHGTGNIVATSNYNPWTVDITRNVDILCVITNTYVPQCGDGVTNGSEQCDDGILNGIACIPPYGTEGQAVSCTYCSSECQNVTLSDGYCGDGIIQSTNEECDGTAPEHNICTASCTLQYVPYCGDGIPNQPSEQCDDGNTDETDGCDNSCRALGSISGVKFQDNDGDANAKEPGEFGLSGWTIEVRDLAGALIGSAITGADGSYSLPNLLEGTYNVCEVTQESEWTRTYPGNNCYLGVALDPGSELTGYDFGNFQNVDIKVCKDIDSDGDGQGDTPYTDGWLMTLAKNGQTYDSQNTGTDGCYTWTNLEPGLYSIAEETKTGWTPTGATTYDFGTVLSGQPYSHTFGNFQNVSVTACKLADADGLIGTTTDRGNVSGWPVYLTIDSVRQTVQNTSTNGCYTWTNLGPNHSYGVSEDVTTGWTALTPTTHSFGSATSGNSTYSNNFVNTALGKIIIEKQTTPNTDTTTEFEFSASYKSNFFLHNMDTDTSEWLVPGQYTVSELAKTGWDMSNLVCSDSDQGTTINGSTAYIDLDAGQEVHCTFDNTQRGEIIIKKVMIGGADSFDFTGDVQGTISTNNGTLELNNALTDYDYSSQESPKTGWDLTDISCDDGSSNNPSLFDLPTRSAIFRVDPGETVTCTFTNTKRGSISGYKYEDVLANETKDIGDSGLPGWTIELYQAPSQYVTSTTTITDGSYSFNDLVSGWYYVCEVAQDGWQRITPALGDCSFGFQVVPGANVSDIDFGNYKLGSISGTKFEDINGNGVKDNGELGLSGWTIYLDLNANGLLDNGEPTQVTASDGSYFFTNLSRGQYHGGYSIREVLQTGWIRTVPESSYWISTPSGTDENNKDFGNFKLGEINACKYEDHNGNGIKETEDIALNGVSMILYKQDAGGGWISQTNQVTVNDGCTLFTDLTYGQYRVQEDYSDPDLAGYYPSNGNSISTPPYHEIFRDFSISSGSKETATFLNSKYRTISGQKFEDINGNGIKDSEDLGLSGWTIFIDYNEDGTPSLGEPSTITDGSGNYQFTGLVADWYRVAEDLQTGWLPTLPVAGYYGVELHNDYSASDVDFGNYQYGKILVCKYDDLNSDGQLGEEPTISGVQMDLYKWEWVKDELLPLDDGLFMFTAPLLVPALPTLIARGHYEWVWQNSQNTEENGCTLFSELLSGDYRVFENAPTGYYQTAPLDPDYFSASIESGTDLTFNFLNARFGSIGDTIYEDTNGNSIQDLGEPGIEGVNVNLYQDNGNGIFEPGAGDTLISGPQATIVSGQYLFEGLVAGAYWIKVNGGLPVGYSLTTANDPTLVQLVAGDVDLDVDFGYKPIPPSIELEKTNDKTGGALAGGTVIYTLTITNGQVPLSNIEVKDSLPVGFTYVSGSTTGASEPVISGNMLEWTIDSLNVGEVAVISYQAKIDNSQQAGKYYNLATCRASTSRGQIENDTFVARTTQIEEIVNCNLASSEVPIGQSFSYSSDIGGSVLGVSTVLGAATGSETYWLIMAIIMMSSGLLLINRKRFIK